MSEDRILSGPVGSPQSEPSAPAALSEDALPGSNQAFAEGVSRTAQPLTDAERLIIRTLARRAAQKWLAGEKE
jgi:hypothetical protein